MTTNSYAELAAVDCSRYIEKKGNLSYLSWAWAVDQLLRRDPAAEWTYGEPIRHGETMMVVCTVTAFGRARTMHLPVMDHKNKAIANPDAFAVNTAMMRCLVKAIALHGLGLYIYAGEDVPRGEDVTDGGDEYTQHETAALQKLREVSMAGTVALRAEWAKLNERLRERLRSELPSLKEAAAQADAAPAGGGNHAA